MPWKESIRALGAKWVLIALCVLAVLAYLRFAPDSLKPWTNAPQPPMRPGEPRVVAKIERAEVPGPAKVRVIKKKGVR